MNESKIAKFWVPSLAFVGRLRKSYALALKKYEVDVKSVLWGCLLPAKQQDIHDALLTSDSTTQSLLSNMRSHNLYMGVDAICRDLLGDGKLVIDAPNIFQLLVRLGIAVGALPFHNPEGGSKFPDGREPPVAMVDELIGLLERRLGFEIAFPDPFNGEAGFATPRGVASYRAVHAIYQGFRIRQTAELVGGGRVLEIGGGTGRTAFYARAAGIEDITLIDLPLGMVRMACFLGATLGEDAIWLYGEKEPTTSRIKIAPSSFLFSRGQYFDVAVNVDSLTEMSRAEAEAYIKYVNDYTKCFISINHEANEFTVRDLCPQMWRSPYFMRDGYAEEIAFNL